MSEDNIAQASASAIGLVKTHVASAEALAKTVIALLPDENAPKVTPNVIQFGRARYEETGLLGEGGMGRVVSATDRQFGRVIALKELKDGLLSPALLKRFLTEAVVTGNLEHPGVPAVYERGVGPDGSPYYAMRRIEGRTLGEAIEACKTREDRLKLLPAVVKVAQTLAYAHEYGVVHRDIKPDNIILGRHGETVVLDWGIAKIKGLASSEVMPGAKGNTKDTQAGQLIGTLSYMAPEQARGQTDAIDARTDVFAIGGLLYHVLSGSAPYTGTSACLLGKKQGTIGWWFECKGRERRRSGFLGCPDTTHCHEHIAIL